MIKLYCVQLRVRRCDVHLIGGGREVALCMGR